MLTHTTPVHAKASATATAIRRLNIGCGGRFHPAWVNVDLHPQFPSIVRCDARGRLPFPDAYFDAVYHAHLLEHLPRARAWPFLRECRRVLKPGGVLRVVVPDLEQIARLYLDSLDEAWEHQGDASRRHTWAMLEMYDQVTRERPGGDMLDYLADAPCDLAWHRLGADGDVIRHHLASHAVSKPERGTNRFTALLFGNWRERLIRWLLGSEYGLLQQARFRASGEIHQWMYDRHSLRELLDNAGFDAIRVMRARDSRIPGWGDEHLDTAASGTPFKPDSLYVEAIRP